MGYMYNDSALFLTGAMALSQSAYISWGSGINNSTTVGFAQNRNGTLLFKDNITGSWTELGNSRDNTQLGDAASDIITANGQFSASVGAFVASSKKLKLGAAEEWIYGDGTDIHFGVGSGGDINIPVSIGLTFGDDGEKIESDGTDLTIASGGDIVLNPAGSDVLPPSDNTVNLGSASKRWANLYTADLHLKNDRGDWTIIEEEDYLCVVNNKTKKKYKMLLEEIKD